VLSQLAPALASGASMFLASEADAATAAATLTIISNDTGNGRLDRATAQLRSQLPLLRSAALWLAAAPALLGEGRPTTILIALQNPAELRATGGFIGAAGLVVFRKGRVRISFSGSILRHEIASVPPPLPEAVYTNEGAWLFRDANWSPDFPLAARTERFFFGADTGVWATTVVAMDDSVMSNLLEAVGPLYLPAYGRWVTAANVNPLATYYVKASAYHGPLTVGTPDTIAKQFFGWVLRALISRLQTLPVDRWARLGHTLASPMASRDITLYDLRPAVEDAIRASGADGSLAPVPGDFLYVVDDNRSYNKINPYISESLRYDVMITSRRRPEAVVRIRYRVNPSPADLEGFGPGFGLFGNKHDYQDFIRVYVPRGATLRSMAGVDAWAPRPAYGFTQFAGRLLLREGESRTVTIRYSLPPSVFTGSGADVYRLTIRHQPGSDIRSARVVVESSGGAFLVENGKAHRSLDVSRSMARDARLDFGIGGLHPPIENREIRLVGATDPYIPFAYLHFGSHGL
jgi:hypothetical protein